MKDIVRQYYQHEGYVCPAVVASLAGMHQSMSHLHLLTQSRLGSEDTLGHLWASFKTLISDMLEWLLNDTARRAHEYMSRFNMCEQEEDCWNRVCLKASRLAVLPP